MLNLKTDNSLSGSVIDNRLNEQEELKKSINLGYKLAKQSGLRTIIDEEFEHRFAEINND